MTDTPRTLRELVTKWREIENAETKIPGTAALDGNDCADELGAALAAATPPSMPDDYVAWVRYKGSSIQTCDSDAKGAFKVYRHPAQRDRQGQ